MKLLKSSHNKAYMNMEKLKEEDLKGRIANLELIVAKLQQQIDIIINLWEEKFA